MWAAATVMGPQRRRRERRAPRRRGALLGEQRGVGVRRGEESGEAGGEADLILRTRTRVHGGGWCSARLFTPSRKNPANLTLCSHSIASSACSCAALTPTPASRWRLARAGDAVAPRGRALAARSRRFLTMDLALAPAPAPRQHPSAAPLHRHPRRPEDDPARFWASVVGWAPSRPSLESAARVMSRRILLGGARAQFLESAARRRYGPQPTSPRRPCSCATGEERSRSARSSRRAPPPITPTISCSSTHKATLANQGQCSRRASHISAHSQGRQKNVC